MITYAKNGDWGGYSLQERPDGNWRYEGWCQIQGCNSGRVVVLAPPKGFNILDEADMDTNMGERFNFMSKSEYLMEAGTEIRCLRRGHIIQ